MDKPCSEQLAPPSIRRSLAFWLRRVKVSLIALFVVLQLFFMVFRGGLDLWYSEITGWLHRQKGWRIGKKVFEPIDTFTTNYGNFCGIEQGWRLFSGPMDRHALFLAARIEFADGSEAWVYSENEPDPKRFLRVGGWRQRKLEDGLAYSIPDQFEASPELPVWKAFARYCLRRWRADNPGDSREVSAIVLFTRQIAFPEPGTDPCAFEEPEVAAVVVFDANGELP